MNRVAGVAAEDHRQPGSRPERSRGHAQPMRYLRLARAGYLSGIARRHRDEVLSHIERSIENFEVNEGHLIGAELWRRLQDDLADRRYLSWWAYIWGFRFVPRTRTW